MLHVCASNPVCFPMLTWVYWPRWYPGGRSSGIQSPASCCRHSVWSSVSLLPPLPGVSSPEDPNLSETRKAAQWSKIQSINSSKAKPTDSLYCFSLYGSFTSLLYNVYNSHVRTWASPLGTAILYRFHSFYKTRHSYIFTFDILQWTNRMGTLR